MKTILQINGKDTEVVLTDGQVEQIIEEHSKSKDICNRVKTFEDAIDIAVHDPKLQGLVSDYRDLMDRPSSPSLKYTKAAIITAILNEGWEPDWSDSSQKKYYGWFKPVRSGFAFYICGSDITGTSVGSRLYFKEERLVKHASKMPEFLDFIKG